MPDYPLDTTVTDHLLATTRAVRKRLDLERPVEREVLLECLRLAVQAPTAGNGQGWHWMVVTDAAKRTRLKELYDGMARPYLESQAEGAEDPQTRRVYQSAVYLLEILDRIPVHVIPCIEGRLDQRRQLRRRQHVRLDPPGGVELHARPAVAGPRLGVDHAPPRATRPRPPSCSASPTA